MQRVLLITLALNLLVAAAKGVVGLWVGSLAIASDALHSALDAGANLIGIVAARLAARPPDPGHPYGHRKFEVVASLALGGIIAVGGLSIARSAVEALIAGIADVDPSLAAFGVMLATLGVNVFVVLYERREGRRLNSPYLLADASHTASDVIVTLGVLVSLGLARAGFHWADPVSALLVFVIIARVAYQVIRRNLVVLVDAAAVDPGRVRAIALQVPGITGCHRVRSRGTQGAVHLDLHLQMSGELSLRRAHALTHEVERRLRDALPEVVDVTIHTEPSGDEPEGL